MDEPLSNLDARLRGQMRVEIAQLQRAAGVTTVYVTHDQVEAMTMGDRVAVMREGVLQQLGAPRQLYDRPVNLFVATFLGAPPMNLLQGAPRLAGEGMEIETAAGRIALAPDVLSERPGLAAYVDREVILGVRPEAAALAGEGEAGLPGIVAFQEDLGANVLTTIELAAHGQDQGREGALLEELGESDIPRVSRRVRINTQSGAKRARGEPVRVAFDAARLHMFDPVSKLAIA